MSEQPTPWRKRHPVVSRLILYVLGLGLAAVLTVMFLERQEIDEQDRQAALAEELDALGIIHVIDPDGSQVLRVLDEKFSSPDLPVQVQGRALRWRALALRKQARHEDVEAVLIQADALALEPDERTALHLEWAEARLERGDAAGAIETLPGVRQVAEQPVFAILRALLFAQAKREQKRLAAGLADLREVLAVLEAPVDDERERYVGGREWTAVQTAAIATEFLAKADEARALEAWRRLQQLAPQSFEAQLGAARGYLALGRDDEARSAWQRARALDPQQAEAEAGRDENLARLDA